MKTITLSLNKRNMRKKSYKTVNLTKINIAHREACAKHTKFCDDFTGARERFIVDELERWRKVNSCAPYHADAILNEEILEALEAYKQGDLKHCLQELAQCGAVILRMMQFVENEMEA